MIEISKQERDYLESRGMKFGDGLQKTLGNSKKCTYYLTEYPWAVASLAGFRDRHTIERHRSGDTK